MQSSDLATADAAEEAPVPSGRLVLRNTVYLGIAQALGMPLSILLNAVMGRYLGAEQFGIIYFATTLATFGFLAVDWGRQFTLPAAIARDHSAAGRWLGTSILWCLGASGVIYGVLAFGSYLFGYGPPHQWALGLVFIVFLLAAIVSCCQDTIRGFERTDIGAIGYVGQQFMTALLVIPVLMLGGLVRATLIAQACAVLVVLLFVWRTLRPVGVGSLSAEKGVLRSLLVNGTPFVVFNLAMVLQPNIDAVFLSKLAPPDVMGWYAAARRLIGVLLFPAAALIGALYPTLCRLHESSPNDFKSTATGAIQGVGLLTVPITLGCALYPEIGVSIFGESDFGPAADNLRVFSVYLFLVYFSMPIGTILIAAGRQRAWTIIQSLCIAVSVALDPILVPWFQSRSGNGGMGLCVASGISELLVFVGGLLLLPRGILARGLVRSMAMALLSGGAMAGTAYLLSNRLNPFIAAPISVAVYVAALWVTGGIQPDQVAMLKGFFRRKFSR